MIQAHYTMKAKVWLYPAMVAWHFLTVPKKESAQIRWQFAHVSRGFGSIPVTVAIGKTSWKTSIFWDSKASAYLLPLKAEVRKKEGVKAEDTVSFTLDIKA